MSRTRLRRVTYGGEDHPGPGSGEQPHSELALELLDQRRLGHEQPRRRAGEVAFGSDGGKGVALRPRGVVRTVCRDHELELHLGGRRG